MGAGRHTPRLTGPPMYLLRDPGAKDLPDLVHDWPLHRARHGYCALKSYRTRSLLTWAATVSVTGPLGGSALEPLGRKV